VKSVFKNDPAKMEEKIRAVNNTCFQMSRRMGKRRLDDDHGGADKGNFQREFVYATYDTPQPDKNAYIYGALARDVLAAWLPPHRGRQAGEGRTRSDHEFSEEQHHGQFYDREAEDIFGPFEDDKIVTDPMNNSLASSRNTIRISRTRGCAATVTHQLPLMDNPSDDPNTPHLEQLTYLEWLTAGYQNELGNNPKARTCQDCH